jgi:hypothetical protein
MMGMGNVSPSSDGPTPSGEAAQNFVSDMLSAVPQSESEFLTGSDKALIVSHTANGSHLQSITDERSLSPGRKKSLPPIKVPEQSSAVPVIVSRAVYNRYVFYLFL